MTSQDVPGELSARDWAVDGGVAGGARVALLMVEGEDRRLLSEWLGRRHAVAAGSDAAVLDGDVDLCVIDAPSFARHADAVRARKGRERPAFLPSLLVVDGEAPVDPGVRKEVDEVIHAPVGKAELRARIDGLLARRALSRSLADREARLNAVFEALPDPVLVIDGDGEVEHANPAFCRYTGTEPPAPVGEPFRSIGAFPEGTVETLAEVIEETREAAGGAAGAPRTVEYTGDRGETRTAEVVTASLDDGDGTVLCLLRDVTGRVRRERELEHQNDRLDAFARMLAHEVRNPLNAAQGFHDAMTPRPGDEDAYGRVAAAHDRIQRMTDDLLAHARGDGDWGESTRPVDLGEASRAAWDAVSPRDATLEVDDGGATVEADPDALASVLENLFRNAVEHGDPDATTRVRVGALPDGFYVEDDGPGIPEEEREEVFEPGYTTSRVGTGLGLTLVRKVAAAHGWDVEVSESRGGGVRFEFAGSAPVEGARERGDGGTPFDPGGDGPSNVLVLGDGGGSCPDPLAPTGATDVVCVDCTGSADPDGGERAVVEVRDVPGGADDGAATAGTVKRADDLAGVEAAIKEHLGERAESGRRTAVCFRSVEALLEQVGRERGSRFLDALTDRLASEGALAHYHLDPGAVDGETFGTLAELFDSVVEVDGGEVEEVEP